MKALLAAPFLVTAVTAQEPPRETHAVQGITISTPRSGQDWGEDVIVPTLEEIRTVGANWVATHPYAWIRDDGTVRFRAFDVDAPPEQIVRPIREGQRLGLKVMIKPHLGYWGSKFDWRGAIAFDDPAEQRRFWDSYTEWIVAVARASRDADAFVVGTELDKMLDEGEWRRVIARIREVTDAPLTYAANWTDYRRVAFWDALDVIGVQAYFPIAAEPTADAAELERGWSTRMRELREFATPLDKHVVFTELGYNRAFGTAVEPWAHAMDGPDAETTQLACMRIAMNAIEQEPLVLGSFLWKWFPGRTRRVHDFYLKSEPMRALLRESWKPR